MIKQEKQKIGWLGKDINELSKDELIEMIEYIMPKYIEYEKRNYQLEKENFSLLVDKKYTPLHLDKLDDVDLNLEKKYKTMKELEKRGLL